METCPPPHADADEIRKALIPEAMQAKVPKVISFKRSKFKPYLAKIPDEGQLEQLFLEFLQEKFG